MNLPVSTSIQARPVWKRHVRRTLQNTRPLDPPTEREMHDAILVLEDPTNSLVDGLWKEAHLIFLEASK